MNQYVAFLRGIGLGRRRPKMEQLRTVFVQAGFADVATFIASGNVIFASRDKDAAKLERTIEEMLAAALGYEVDTFVRTRAEVAAAAAFESFTARERNHPTNIITVGFLKQELSPAQVSGLCAVKTKTDAFTHRPREFHWLCRTLTSESEVWKLPALKALKLPNMTLRNRTTVRKIAELYPAG
ncbi:MAG TPA: DUF1697 domain-containing protein [Candidatus Didemnitutus sp.]|nr:DUF1697 domain-containing protein [Candidatus Didemnitutus sp.]